MISQSLLVSSVGVAAYVASTAFEIELPNGDRVSPAASFGPALIAVAEYAHHSLALLVLASIILQALVVGVVRRESVLTISHATGLLLTLFVATLYRLSAIRIGHHATIGVLITVGLSSLAYFEVDLIVKATRLTRRGLRANVLTESTREAVPLMVVLASTAGLIVVGLPAIGWAIFPLMFLPVFATRNEFARWGSARRTYDETVRTLAGLAEGAGYIPDGHSTRVAELSVKIGRELSLPAKRLHELELVGLLHDVGAVSLSDPSDLAGATAQQVAESTGYLLQETEYLAHYAEIVRDIASGASDLPIEGRILRVADRFESLDGPSWRRMRVLSVSAAPGDEDVIDALERVVRVT